MSSPAPQTDRGGARTFFGSREPGALLMLVVIAISVAAQGWMLWAWPEVDGGYWARSARWLALLPGVVALFLFRKWSLPVSPAYPEPQWELPRPARRWALIMAASVAALAIWPRAARMDFSLHSGEIRQIAAVTEPGGLVAESGLAALAFPEKPRSASGVSERNLRIAPVAAGVLTAGLMVLLGAALGNVRAGLGAGLILALHPGHIRMSSELSDAAVVLLLCLAAVLCLVMALRAGGWRWWLALAGCEALALAGHQRPAVFLLPLNAAGVMAVMASSIARRDRIALILRQVAALAPAGAVVVMPWRASGQPWSLETGVTALWARMLAGVDWAEISAGKVAGCDMAGTITAAPWRGPLAGGVLAVLAVLGLLHLFREDWRTRMAGAAVLPVAVLFPDGALLFLPVLLAWGAISVARRFPGSRRLLHAPLIVALLYLATVAPILQRMIQIPVEPLREAARSARKAAGPQGTVAVYGPAARAARFYDPPIREIHSVAQLEALIDVAYAQELPLLVFRSRDAATGSGRESNAALDAKLARSGQFHAVQELAGFIPVSGMDIFAYRSREQVIPIQIEPTKK